MYDTAVHSMKPYFYEVASFYQVVVVQELLFHYFLHGQNLR